MLALMISYHSVERRGLISSTCLLTSLLTDIQLKVGFPGNFLSSGLVCGCVAIIAHAMMTTSSSVAVKGSPTCRESFLIRMCIVSSVFGPRCYVRLRYRCSYSEQKVILGMSRSSAAYMKSGCKRSAPCFAPIRRLWFGIKLKCTFNSAS